MSSPCPSQQDDCETRAKESLVHVEEDPKVYRVERHQPQ